MNSEKKTATNGGIFNSNKITLVFSFILALVIWITVSPERTITITVPLNVSTENTAVGQLGLEVVDGQGQMVDVEVKGKWYVLSNLTESDIRLSVPFTNITRSGEQELRVSATMSGTFSDVVILKVVPQTVKLTFDIVEQLPFTITPKVNGATADEGLVAGLPVLNENTVNIKASKTVLNSIGEVVAEVDINKTLSHSESHEVSLKVYDKSGKQIDNDKFVLDLDKVTITQPINRSKDLAIVPTFKNQPAYYSQKPIKYTVSPAKIQVVGDVDVVDKIDSISLDPIDFTSITPSSNKFTYAASLPKGVTPTNEIGIVFVTIDVSSITTNDFTITQFKGVNLPEGKTVKVTVPSKTVTVAGDKNTIPQINDGDLYLEYDMSALNNASGEHVVNATLKSAKFNNVWGVGQIQIQVSIS